MPYKTLPWCLASIVDPSVDTASKERLARWFCNLNECCHCQAVCRPLKRWIQEPQQLLTGKGKRILEALFQTKNTNIECETNFARAHSAKMATRGRNDCVHQMAAKHFLAEVKHIHRSELESLCSTQPATSDGSSLATTPGS